MEMKIILTACIITFGIVQPDSQIQVQAVTEKMNDESRIEKKFQKLFDYIAENDTEKSQIYREVLKEEMRIEGQAFHSMKEEMRNARNRNGLNRRNSCKNNNMTEKVVEMVKRQVVQNSSRTKIIRRRTNRPSTIVRSRWFQLRYTEAKRLRALNSDMSEFLATYVTRETFRPTLKYAHHQRHTRKDYHITWERPTKITSKKAYTKNKDKYYPTHLERRKMIYRHLANILAGFDEERKQFLTQMQGRVKTNDCYNKVINHFMRKCFYDYYYLFTGMKHIRYLMSNACHADWLTEKKINRVIDGCCGVKFKFQVFPNLLEANEDNSTVTEQTASTV